MKDQPFAGVFALSVSALVAVSLRSFACSVIACICACIKSACSLVSSWASLTCTEPLCEFKSAHDVAFGITEDFVVQFAWNRTLKEMEVTANRLHLLDAFLGDFAHVGGDFEL